MQHFPQSAAQPPLENLLPHLHSVTFPAAAAAQPVPVQSPEAHGSGVPSAPLSDSMVSISVEELKELRKLQAKAEEVWSDDDIMEEVAKESVFTHARDEEIRARASQLQGDLDAPGPSSGVPSGLVPPPLVSSSSYSTSSAPSQEMPSSYEEAGLVPPTSEGSVLPSSSSSTGSKPPVERWVLFDDGKNSVSSSRSDKKKVPKQPVKKSTRTETKKGKADTKPKPKGSDQPKKEDGNAK